LQEGIWTWAAIDADNRLIAGWIVGDRRLGIASIFMADVKRQLALKASPTSP
jgi:transposase-like protein